MPALPPNEDLVSLIAGEVDVATLASRHGVSEQAVQQWRSAFLAGMKASAAGRSVSRRSRHRLVIAAVAVLATAASAQLALFTPNQPALASAVNGNFTQLKTWLEAKVGPVGSGAGGNSNITTGTISTTGAATVGGAANFGSTTRQMINLWNADYGIGIQSGTEYSRTGANFAWYKGGTHSDTAFDSGGGSTLMTLDTNGVIRGPTYGFGGMYTTNGAAPAGSSGVCGFGAAASYAQNNPITGAQSCPAGFTAAVIFILDYCWPNVGAQRATTYMCWK